MMRREGEKIYGTAPVILQREVDGVFEFLIGYAAPFSGILVQGSEFGPFVEEPHEFWQEKGFSITEAPVLDEARSIARARNHEPDAKARA